MGTTPAYLRRQTARVELAATRCDAAGIMGHVSDTHDNAAARATPRMRSGTFFVIVSGVFLLLFAVFLWVVSPRLQDQLGLNEGVVGFDPPSAPVQVPLTLDGDQVGVAEWNAEGVCAEMTDSTGTIFRTCAEPDPLKPIWAIDAPDQANPPYLLVATAKEAASVAGTTQDGEGLNGLTQARELPAAWAIIPLSEGSVVARLIAQNNEGADMGEAVCGVEDAPTDGPARLAGGCLVPRED